MLTWLSIGGVLTDQASWRWCFYINLPCGAITAILIFFFVRPVRVPSSKKDGLKAKIRALDIEGNFLFTSLVICLLLALEWGGSKYPWNEPRIIALFVTSGVLFVIFMGIQIHREDKATVPMRLIKKRCVWGPAIYSFCIPGIFAIFTYYVSKVTLIRVHLHTI